MAARSAAGRVAADATAAVTRLSHGRLTIPVLDRDHLGNSGMEKIDVVASLGQRRLLRPAWVKAALAANDRLKLYLSVLQAAELSGPVGGRLGKAMPMLDTDKDGVLSQAELAVAMKGFRLFGGGASAEATPAAAKNQGGQ